MIDQDETLVFALERPITHQQRAYETLTLRRPLVRDLIAAERQPGETGQDAALVAACADVPLGVVAQMDAADFKRLQREAAPLLADAASAAAGDDSSSSSTAIPTGASPSSAP